MPLYGCLAYHKRGPEVCGNRLVLPVTRVDDAVLRAFAGDALDPAVITVIIDAVFAALQPEHAETDVAALKDDLRAVEGKIANLVAAVERADGLEPLVAQLRERQKEREALLVEIAAAQAVNQIHADRAEVERKVQAQVAKWRALVETAVVSDGRQLLNEMLDGPLRFTPEGRTYRFVGPLTTGRLIAGMVYPPNGSSPTRLLPACALPAVPITYWMPHAA